MTKLIYNKKYHDSLSFALLIGCRKDNYSRWAKTYIYRGHEGYDYFLNKEVSTVTQKRYWLSDEFCQALCVAYGKVQALRERKRFLKPY